ncbi:MAG TPA: glycosyltransferase family 1 protein [Actinotalea sp.]|nr:glycosyltransferase family 1 protein [Actinotalea sp.]
MSHPVVDLDLCARSDFHNGIQRVARETAQRWAQRHQVTPVAWTDTGGSLRDLTRQEELRTTRWSSRHTEIDTGVGPGPAAAAGDEFGLVIPWHTTVVLAEVPLADRCASLSGLAELSGNAVVAIGYDAIPVVSADLRPLGEANAFAAYLTVIKHSARVAGISTSATVEFEGFSQALASQGLPGPEVREVLLPSDVPPPPPGFRRTPSARPRVLSVGRTEPHKNHGALLHAAELLWREGLEFDLDLIGAKGWSTSRVDEQLERLTRAGRPVRWLGPVPDDELWAAIRNASFTVFASLHEGFGLPVSESLACGTPVVTTGYGSQGEIAAGGGCLVVDPRDDADLTAAMRRLLTEPGLEDRLRREALERPDRTWDDYAAELWSVLVEGKQP